MQNSSTTACAIELIHVHELWKTDRTLAGEILTKFHAKFKDGYAPDEMVDMAHLTKRMDRQNNTNGGGSPTSVWTSILVEVANGEVIEGRLSELYPHGVSVPTYDFAVTGQISQGLIDADLASVVDPNNKNDSLGQDTAYEGKTWREVVGAFLGQAMEVAPGKASPSGFLRVPIEHKQPPMVAAGQYTALDLYWRDGNHGLTRESFAKIKQHIRGFNMICANEHLDDQAQVLPFVEADENYRSEIRQLNDWLEACSS